MSSGARSLPRSGVTMWEMPFSVTAMSAGVDVRSWVHFETADFRGSIDGATHLLEEIRGEHEHVCVLVE